MATTLRRTFLSRWPAVLIGCVLSVLAPFGESVVLQVFDTHPTHARDGKTLSERDGVEDEEDLYRGRASDVQRRVHARAVAPLHAAPADASAPAGRSRRPTPAHHRPGCEHACRNGLGGPLLC